MGFFGEIKQRYGEAPATVLIGGMKGYAVPPEHYGTLINDTKTLTNKKLSEVAMQQVFGSNSQLYFKDRSGVMTTSLPGKELPPHLRVWHFKHKSAQVFFNGRNLRQSTARMEDCLSSDLAQVNPNDPVDSGEWVEIPDFYRWWRTRQMAAGLKALCGPHLVRLSPSIADDLWEFFEGWPLLTLPLSSLHSAKTLAARRRILDAIKKWHAFAKEHKDYEKEDPDYDEYWGGPHFRARYAWCMNSGMMDEEAIAAEDFSLIANASYNVKTLSFYIIAEVFNDPALYKRMEPEFEGMITNRPSSTGPGVKTLTECLHIDIEKITSSPLLQSVYAEILRMRVSAFLSRSPAQDNTSYNLGNYALKDDGQALLLLPMAHHNPDLWKEERQKVSLEKFWSDRFLDIESNGEEKFSTKSLQENAWYPYGGGSFICPGKALAKQQMLAATVLFSAYFDMEMLDDGVPASDSQFLGGSVPPPVKPTRVRVRRKVGMVGNKAEK
ncbi:cytochrome P450 [Diaporthe sp. PMI_573]|nr:cytochrome P450 [Diaporthaceae sp. PMI_573]